MGKDIEELTSGNLDKRFILRGNDEIKELAGKLNEMAQSLRSKVIVIKEALVVLESSLKDASPETKKNIQNFKEAISKLNV
jgi:methyl-accepting chemotaxis protein